MNELERVLSERCDALILALTQGAGFSPMQAARFIEEAGPAVVESYRWQADELPIANGWGPAIAQEILAGVNGRSLAPRVGLTEERSWAGLRTLVWAAAAEMQEGQ
jgi:hypothetical protein